MFSFVPTLKHGAKSLTKVEDTDFTKKFEDGTKVKIPSKIKRSLRFYIMLKCVWSECLFINNDFSNHLFLKY